MKKSHEMIVFKIFQIDVPSHQKIQIREKANKIGKGIKKNFPL
jgi:hypothetical protein